MSHLLNQALTITRKLKSTNERLNITTVSMRTQNIMQSRTEEVQEMRELRLEQVTSALPQIDFSERLMSTTKELNDMLNRLQIVEDRQTI